MANIVTSVSDLGTSGGVKGLQLPSGHIEWLTWDGQVWKGKPKWTMKMVSNVGMSTGGSVFVWRYPGDTRELPGYDYIYSTSFGFQIYKVDIGGEFWASGLRMQENLTAFTRTMQAPEVGAPPTQIALAWYPLDDGEDFLSPTSFNHGVKCVAWEDDVDVGHYTTSGWQRTPDFATPPTADQILYPEIYLTGLAMNFRQFSAQHRWVYGPGMETVGSQPATNYLTKNMMGWWKAEDIIQADNTAVAAWPDAAGMGANLKQSDTAKQPVVMTESGIRFVRFDGTNDRLRVGTNQVGQNDVRYNYTAPLIVFLVARQRSGGGGTQMWLNTGIGGASMIYSNGTSQLRVWAGGGSGDMIGTTTFGNWKVYSIRLRFGAAGDIWENLTSISNGVNPGDGGFDGYCLGNSFAEDFPAKIDVAEAFAIWGRDMDSTERTQITNDLMAKYNL